MDELESARDAKSQRSTAWARGLGRLLLGLCVLVLVTAVILPGPTLAWLRSDYRALGQPLNWLETISPVIDLEHVLLFGGIGFLLRCIWQGARWWWVVLALAMLAMGTEALQFAVPGRTPRIVDLRDDLLGALIGWLLATVFVWMLRRRESVQGGQ